MGSHSTLACPLALFLLRSCLYSRVDGTSDIPRRQPHSKLPASLAPIIFPLLFPQCSMSHRCRSYNVDVKSKSTKTEQTDLKKTSFSYLSQHCL